MIRESLSLTDILIGFENTLKIEYKEKDTEKLIAVTKQRLENTFQVKLVGSIYDVQATNRFLGDSINVLLAQLVENMKSLALLLSVSMFDQRYGQSIKDVNYLGFAKENLLAALRFLQAESLYEDRGSFLGSLRRSLDNVEICAVKRLLVIMMVLEDLGVKEGVALIAQYLYIGGLYQ